MTFVIFALDILCLCVLYIDRKLVEYYNPDYSKAKLPEVKDYRRTLYWNPNVTTDNFGQASIEFYNNSVCNIIDVSAEGITRYGQFLVNE